MPLSVLIPAPVNATVDDDERNHSAISAQSPDAQLPDAAFTSIPYSSSGAKSPRVLPSDNGPLCGECRVRRHFASNTLPIIREDSCRLIPPEWDFAGNMGPANCVKDTECHKHRGLLRQPLFSIIVVCS